MLSSWIGVMLGGGGGDEAKDDEIAPRLPLDECSQDKPCALNASPASTATPGGNVAESPLSASPGTIRAPPGLDDEWWPAVPPLPLYMKELDIGGGDKKGGDAQSGTPLKVSLADALPEKKGVDPSTPVVKLADALPEPGLSSEVKAPADGTPFVSLAEALPEPEVGSEELPTLGSRGHRLGNCKPCAFLHTKGCKNGTECQFCHLCERGEKKQRRRERWQQKQVEKQLEYAMDQQAQVVSAVMMAAATMPLMPMMSPYPMLSPMMADMPLMDPTSFYLPTTPTGFEAPTPVSLADALGKP